MLNYDIEPRVILNWNLFKGFAAKIDKERLEMMEAQSEGNLQMLVENTLQQVVKAYYLAQLEQSRLRISEKLMLLSSDKYRYVKIKKELGSAVTTDLLLEQSNYLTDSARVVNGRLTFRNAQRDLNLLFG